MIKIPAGFIASALRSVGIPEILSYAIDILVREVIESEDPVRAAQRATAAAGSKAASDAIIDEALKATNVMDK